MTPVYDQISTVLITGSGSSNYYVGDELTVDQTAISGATSNWTIDISADNIDATGISSVDVQDGGQGYYSGDKLIVSSSDIPGSSNNLEFDLTSAEI